MSKFLDRNIFLIIIIYALIQTAYLITEYKITGGKIGVPLDDVWIHFRFAENFSSGHFFEYNIGEPAAGTTSPLWVIILSVPFIFSDNLIIPYALMISSLSFLAALIGLYKLSLDTGINSNYSFLITLITLLTGRLLWSSLSGMEITLFILVCVIIFRIHIKEINEKKINILNGVLLAIACNLRPEAYLLVILYYISIIILIRKEISSNIKNILFSGMICLLLILPYPLFCYSLTGSFLPNTYRGQVGSAQLIPNVTYIIESSKLFIKDNFVIFILWLVSGIYFIVNLFKKKLDSRFILIGLWIFLLPLISSFVASNWRHHGRYLIPLIPFINLFSIYILHKIFTKYKELFGKRINLIRNSVIAVILIASINSAVIFANATAWNAENINNQQGRIADWLNENLPNEKSFGMNDIGIITYKTKKYTVDMAGLITPEVLDIQKLHPEEGSKKLFDILKNKGVNYIIIYPDWFEYIMDNYKDRLTYVHSQKLQKNTICGGDEMYIYKINWDKF